MKYMMPTVSVTSAKQTDDKNAPPQAQIIRGIFISSDRGG
jgi:hypothetical protein